MKMEMPCTLGSRVPAAVLTVCIALLAAVNAGSASSRWAAESGRAPARLVGTYDSTLTRNYPVLGFYKGRYTLYVKPGNQIAFTVLDAATFPNKASFTGNRLFLAIDGQCTTTGLYRWTLRGRQLTLTKLRDACRPRAVLLSRTWTRR